MDTSDVYTQIFQSLMPLIQIAIVLWAAETLLTMFIKEHRKSKKKKEREASPRVPGPAYGQRRGTREGHACDAL